MKKTWRKLKCILQWKKPVWKWYVLYDSNHETFWKSQNYGVSKKISSCQGLEEREKEGVEHRGFLGQWKYPVGFCNDRYMSLYIFP